MKKNLLIASLIALSSLMAAGETVTQEFSYGSGYMAPGWGTGETGTYDVAIAINNPALIGGKIISIDGYGFGGWSNCVNYRVWLTSALNVGADGKNSPDLIQEDTEIECFAGFLGAFNHTFSTPVTIPEGGLYAGYSFDVDQISFEEEKEPVMRAASGDAVPGSFLVHTPETYSTWTDISESTGKLATIKVVIEFDEYKSDGAGIYSTPRLYAQSGEELEAQVIIANHSTEPITSIDYKIEVGDVESTGTYTFENPVAATFGKTGAAKVVFPALTSGTYNYYITITSVNGNANEDAEATGTNVISVMDKMPYNRPLCEEYTGLWCGFCVDAWAGMIRMNERHPEDFICISYHNGDAMAIDYPRQTTSFPALIINRSIDVDPVYGEGDIELGIDDLWKEYQSQFTPVDIDVECKWADENHTLIEATSTVNWAAEPERMGEYRVEYVLVADGLTSPEWYQRNYRYDAVYRGSDDLIGQFYAGGDKATEWVTGLVYDDIAVATSGNYGVANSITDTSAGAVNTHTYTFDISENNIIQDKSNLHVVAFVLFKDENYFMGYGLPLNANKGKVPTVEESGFASITADEVVAVAYYDLTGRRIENPSHGLYIRSILTSKGEIISQKVIK